MKYIALWLGIVAALGFALILGVGGIWLVRTVSADPTLVWVPLAILGIVCVATLAVCIEYLTEHRRPASLEGEVIEQ